MYKTPDGTRILKGGERRLFVESLGMIVDHLTLDDFPSEIPLFADLTRNQMIAAYHTVARALLCEDEPPPALTAVLEAAVASIYDHAGDMLGLELSDDGLDADYEDVPELPSWRDVLLAAGRELDVEDLPRAEERDIDAWDLLMGCLEDHVLWDRDWEMVAHLDAAPEAARRAKRELGIAEDYFVAIPGDPTDAEAERLLDELRTLTADAR